MWNDLKSYFQMLVAGMVKSEEGQTLVEYALILFVISIGVLIAMQALTGALNGVLGQISGAL